MLGSKLYQLGKIQLGVVSISEETIESLSSDLSLQSFLIKKKSVKPNLQSTLTLDHTLDAVNTKGLHNSISLAQSLSYTRGKIINISNSLDLSSSLGRQITFTRSLENQIEFKSSQNIDFGNQVINKPEVIVTKVKRYVTLVFGDYLIVLPPPVFSNKEAVKAQVTLHKTIGGTLYAYGKRNTSRILNYTFDLSRIKGLELRQFIEGSKGNLIFLETWEGQVWYSFITNNPVTFTTVSRASPQRELVRVTLEFDGIRLL